MAPEMLPRAGWVLPWRPQMIAFTVSGSSLAIGDSNSAVTDEDRPWAQRSLRCFAPVDRTVQRGHPHAAQPQGTHGWAAGSERPLDHVVSVSLPASRCQGRLPSVSPLQPTSAAERASGRRLAGPYACRSGLAAAGAIRPLRAGNPTGTRGAGRARRVSTGDAMDLTLTDEEASVLRQVLEGRLSELNVEVRHSVVPAYRGELKARRSLLHGIWERLPALTPVESIGAGEGQGSA